MRSFCLLLVFFTVQTLRAQIPNAGFEDWQPVAGASLLGLPFTAQRPVDWNTTDSIIQRFTGPTSVFAGSDAFTGDSCIHLKTVTVGLVSARVPGIATNGTITFIQSPLSFSTTGGTPDTSRSRKLIGRYKFSTTGSADSARISIFKTRYNASSFTREIIASGVYYIDTSLITTTYVPFELQLQYQNWVDRPDTCLIIIQSGQADGDLTALPITNGTELVVDDLSLDGFVGIDEMSHELQSSIELYPSPASTWLEVFIDRKDPSQRFGCRVLDITGKAVLGKENMPDRDRLDVTGMPAGTYFMCLTDADGRIVAQKRFSVAR